jgi:diguanylate cyclase (GGDEF)-like protein
VPGALGRSVFASVEQLSQSLRQQDALQSRLSDQARHDTLTGLLNRAGCLAAVDQALARARRTGTQIAVLAMNLDGFKRVNDAHGHAAGDEVLRTVAERALATVRAGDTVARIASDEFVVIAEAVEDIDHAVVLGERLIAVASQPVMIDGKPVAVGASVGIAVNQDAHEDGDVLLGEAEQAVAGVKQTGRGRVDVFDDGLRSELSARAEIEEALRAGLTAGELELHYQPVVDAATGRLNGFEALARWERPGHGMVPPMQFIPVAESSDLIVEIGRWVLDEATSQLVTWSADPATAGAHVAVNISGRHLVHPSIVDDVRGALERSGLAADRLIVEITETVILGDMTVAVDHLRALREVGVRIAIDDFGTGYTSIGQLGLLPVDILKIDRAFVSRLDQEGERSLVELMVGVAHTLGLGLVAEGVEDDDQLQALRHLACDDVQGYLISRPMRVADVPAWATASPSVAP